MGRMACFERGKKWLAPSADDDLRQVQQDDGCAGLYLVFQSRTIICKSKWSNGKTEGGVKESKATKE